MGRHSLQGGLKCKQAGASGTCREAGGGLGGNGLQEARAGGRGQDASWLPQGRWEPMEGSEPRGRGKPSSDQG